MRIALIIFIQVLLSQSVQAAIFSLSDKVVLRPALGTITASQEGAVLKPSGGLLAAFPIFHRSEIEFGVLYNPINFDLNTVRVLQSTQDKERSPGVSRTVTDTVESSARIQKEFLQFPLMYRSYGDYVFFAAGVYFAVNMSSRLDDLKKLDRVRTTTTIHTNDSGTQESIELETTNSLNQVGQGDFALLTTALKNTDYGYIFAFGGKIYDRYSAELRINSGIRNVIANGTAKIKYTNYQFLFTYLL